MGFISNAKSKETVKMEKLKKLLIDNNFDFVGMTEINKDWRRLPYSESIWGATETWFENRKIQISQNSNTPRESTGCLYGGTASMSMGDLVFRVSSQGQDSRHLGRWSHMTIRGKNNLHTTFVTCYTPVFGSGAQSSYAQQLAYMAQHPDKIPDAITCPRQLFGYDLKLLIESFQSADHQLVIMGDFNSEYTEIESWMMDTGLLNSIKERHGSVGPRTCLRSKDSPIDCIFTSPQLRIRNGGLLSFGRLDSDHRGIWIDIPKFLIFGYNPPPLLHHNARRLKLNDPRVVTKYLSYLHAAMKDHNLFERMDSLHQRTVYPLTDAMATEYEELYALSNKLMEEAERQCRKLKMGSVAWSPAFARATNLVEY